MAWPADDGRAAESAFHYGSLASSKGGLAAIRPGEVFRTVVCGEQDDRVLFKAVVLEVFHDRADDVIELSEAGFGNGPAVFRGAHRLILGGQVRDHVHSRRVEPQEEGLAVSLGLVQELERVGEN